MSQGKKADQGRRSFCKVAGLFTGGLAVAFQTGGVIGVASVVEGCGGSSGHGGGAAPAPAGTPPPAGSKTVLAALHDHVGGAGNVKRIPTQDGPKINEITHPGGVLRGEKLVYTVDGNQQYSDLDGVSVQIGQVIEIQDLDNGQTMAFVVS